MKRKNLGQLLIYSEREENTKLSRLVSKEEKAQKNIKKYTR